MPTRLDLNRYRANFQDETDSAALYRVMADVERSSEIAEVYRSLARVEEAHAAFWAQRIEAIAGVRPDGAPRWRVRIMIWLTRRFGVRAALQRMAAKESENRSVYDDQKETEGTGMSDQERSHARLLARLSSHASPGWDGGRFSQLEGRHGAGGGNALRAAVLGANDGLVSTFCLVMGGAGASFSATVLLATALAGALAGACSMAMGEWISVQSSRELYQRQIAAEEEELSNSPAEELEELVLIYRAKGFDAEEARRIAERVMSDPRSARDTLVREELGINPEDLGGSPWVAAYSSFAVFLLGAMIPALPLTLLDGHVAVFACVASSAVGLFLIGAAITVFTGTNALRAGFRQLFIGAAAAGVTYLAGSLFGQVLG